MIKNYMPKWSDEDFKEKKNPDLTKKMWKLWNYITKRKKDLELIHVYAHNKNNWKDSKDTYEHFCYFNNQAVDLLATYARTNLTNGSEQIITID